MVAEIFFFVFGLPKKTLDTSLKYATFLDQLVPQNALQTLSSLTDQLKIFYLQHWNYQKSRKCTIVTDVDKLQTCLSNYDSILLSWPKLDLKHCKLWHQTIASK